MSIRCDIYDRKLYDIWFAAAPYAAKSKPAKTLRQWAADENIPVCWVQGAGHNANSDKPTEVNLLIETFLEQHHLV